METPPQTPRSKNNIESDHDLILELLAKNQQLLQTSNLLLEKMERRAKTNLILKVVWYAILIGLPMIMYYYLYHSFLGGIVGGNTANGLNVDALRDLIDAYQVR